MIFGNCWKNSSYFIIMANVLPIFELYATQGSQYIHSCYKEFVKMYKYCLPPSQQTFEPLPQSSSPLCCSVASKPNKYSSKYGETFGKAPSSKQKCNNIVITQISLHIDNRLQAVEWEMTILFQISCFEGVFPLWRYRVCITDLYQASSQDMKTLFS